MNHGPLLYRSLAIVMSFSTVSFAAPALELEDVVRRAREQNPQLVAAKHLASVKTSEASAAGVWENPRFTFVDERFPTSSPNVPDETIRHYRLEQAVPFPGKLSIDARMKHHEALLAEAGYRAKERDVVQEVRMRYYQLYLIDQSITLAEQSVAVLSNALASAQGRLGANRASASDVFMAQTELGAMRNQLYQQKQQRTLASIELNTLINQAPRTPLGTPSAPLLADIPISVEELERLTRQESPLYRQALHEVNHSRAMRAYRRLQWAPDFNLMYEKETTPESSNGQQVGVTVSIPLWFTRPLAQNRASQAHLEEAKASAEQMQAMALKMVNMEYVETQTHLTLARNYANDILPAAQSNLKIAQQQYGSGQTDFLRLLEAFRTWIQAHTSYQTELYHVGEHWSELERWAGVDLEEARSLLERMPAQEKSHDH